MDSIIVTENSYLLYHNTHVFRIYSNTRHHMINGTEILSFALKREYFNLENPYIATSTGKNPRKRKLTVHNQEGNEETCNESLIQRLITIATKTETLLRDTNVKNMKNKVKPDLMKTCKGCSSIFKNLCFGQAFDAVQDTVNVPCDGSIHLDSSHVLDRIVSYNENHPRTICIGGEYYLLPRKCTFLMSDACRLDPLLKFAQRKGGFDIIVIDPPWENKSAKRGRKYPWLSLGDIAKLPLQKLAKTGCIIMVWITNKPTIHRFVTDDLFKSNRIQYITEWHWLKITNTGEPVVDFASTHKKPYETLVIGSYRKLPQTEIVPKVFVSTPCSIHSHKPPLDDLLMQINLNSPHCLEMFARNLKPQWTSWGNEVLELQNMKYFDNLEC